MSWSLNSRTSGLRLAFSFLVFSLFAVTSFAYPTARTLAGTVYDESVERVILFGGLTGADANGDRFVLNDTWQFTGRRWIQQFPAHAPAARAGMVMVYDEQGERTLIFGGYDHDTYFNDVWQYKNGDWSQVMTTGDAPAPRRFAAGAYDPRLNRLIVYGGGNATEKFYDTWVLDLNTNAWSRIATATPVLKPGALMAYGSARDEILLVGAAEAGATETYRLNGDVWTKLSPTVQPTCVTSGAMVDQRHNGRIVQFGGLCFTNDLITGRSSSTYEWDGQNWIKTAETTTAGTIFGHAMAYDPRQASVILFGGVDVAERQGTYRYTAGTWRPVIITVAYPGPRSLAAAGIDPITREVILYGGRDNDAEHFDFWTRAGSDWRRIPTIPAACGYPVGANDTDRNVFVVVCEGSNVLEWNGTAWKASADFDKDEEPPVRRLSSFVYDPIAKKSFLFGGYELNVFYREMWAWNGTSWTEIETSSSKSPTSRMLAAMFFDPHTQRTIIFGGIGRENRESSVVRYDDMWSFNGSTYTPMAPPTKPSARYGTSVAVAPARTVDGVARPARVLMFGGKSGEEKYLNELWEWTGTTWTRVETVNTPSPRMNATMVFDQKNDRFLLYGGWGGRTFAETWVLKDNVWTLLPNDNGRTRTLRRR